MLEFLYDHVSKPGQMVEMTSETGFDYYDCFSYDVELGQEEYRNRVNPFLSEYKSGFEMTKDGIILAKGEDGLQYILDAKMIPFDEEKVDSKV